jgi:hypothetical protein
MNGILLAAALAGLLVASAGHPPGGRGDVTAEVDGGALILSRAAVDHVVAHETGGVPYYVQFSQRPIDPKFSSGVTVGFGYDLRWKTRAQIRKDWAGVASVREIGAMCEVAGLDGSTYRRIRGRVHISWDEALVVFKRTTLPRWATLTAGAYRIAGPRVLHPHLNGALWGNTFNRGGSMAGESRAEKRAIRGAIAAGRWEEIPGLFDAQARLWPGHAGLQRRRLEEGDLARKALEFSWWQ